MADKPHIRVEMLSDPCLLAGVRQLVVGVCQRLGFDEHACSQVALAVDEALANVIRHGYGREADRPIWLSLWPVEAGNGCGSGGGSCGDGCGCGLRIEIEDEAKHVEEAELCGRDLDDPRPGGLGLHIIREVMDEVSYQKRSPKGMRLTMTKLGPKGAGRGE